MLSDLLMRLRALFRRNAVESELDDELRFHFEQQVEKFVQSGLPLPEARRRARLIFGGSDQIKEECRDARGVHFLETLGQDVRYGLRTLRKSPGFTAVAVLTLALGIGANTSIFSLVYSLALRPLPVKDAGSIVNIYEEFRGRSSRGVHGSPYFSSYPEYLNYRDGSHVFTGLAAYADASLSLGGADAEAISGLLASCNYFDVLGGDMRVGRGFTREDCRASGESAVAVTSDGFWQSHFGGDSAVIGKTLTLNRQVFTIVGVAAKDFSGTELQVPDVWVPLTMAPVLMPDEFGSRDWLELGNVGWLNVVGRLRPGISRKQAEAELAVLAHQFDSNYPGRQTIVRVNSGAYLNSPEIRGAGAWVATAILAIGAFILMIACVNLMNLPLARAATRYQEMGIRLALGASRMRLVRQLLTECILLAMFGGGAGLIVAEWLPSVLVSTVPEMPVSPHINLSLNFTILVYAFLASLVAAVMCGLAPALQSTQLNLVWAPKEKGTPLARGSGRSRLRNSLSTAQVAGCAVLLVAAGLLVRGLHRAESTSPGFITKNVIVASLDLANNGYNETRASAFERDLHDRLAAVPGVVGVARSAVMPCVTGYLVGVTIPGSKAGDGSQLVWGNIVSPDYFQTMGIRLLRGRVFTEREAETSGVVPAVISATMARGFWPGADPLGKRFIAPKTIYQVVGVAPDVQNSHLGQTDGPFFYGASGPHSALDAKLFVRTSGDTSAVAAAVPQLVRQLDPNVRASTETFEQALENILAPPRTAALLVAILGLLAMILAGVGVSGMVAYAASQRTHEIGIRMALGAHPRDIMAMLLRQAAKLSAIGLAIGLALGAGASQWLYAASLLFGVCPLDPATYLTTAIVLASVTMLACYLPARQAMRVDPMGALRYE